MSRVSFHVSKAAYPSHPRSKLGITRMAKPTVTDFGTPSTRSLLVASETVKTQRKACLNLLNEQREALMCTCAHVHTWNRAGVIRATYSAHDRADRPRSGIR